MRGVIGVCVGCDLMLQYFKQEGLRYLQLSLHRQVWVVPGQPLCWNEWVEVM